MCRQIILVLVTLVVGVIATEAQATIPIPTEAQHAVSLNGTWRFKLEQIPNAAPYVMPAKKPIASTQPAVLEPFYTGDYAEDANWHDLAVPSNWLFAP